ncbi:MAG: hypothetical protein HYU67_08255 [Flavobacteriia bacterium]|nr:hypothetical protein [Flavobacteriia bacterium]
METNNDIDQLFKEEFEHWELDPPASVKERIDKQLFLTKNSKNAFWLGFTFLMFTFITFSLFWLNDKSNFNKNRKVSKNQISIASKEQIAFQEKSINTNQNNTSIKYKKSNTNKTNNNSILNSNSTIEKQKISKSSNKTIKTANQNLFEEKKTTNDSKRLDIKNNSGSALIDNQYEVLLANTFESNKIDERIVENEKTNNEIISSNSDLTNLDSSQLSNNNETENNLIVEKTDSSVLNLSRKKKDFPFILSFGIGTLLSKSLINSNSYDIKSKDRNAISLSLLATFPLKNNFGFTTGINYHSFQNQNKFKQKVEDLEYKGVAYETNEYIDSAYIIQYSNRFDTVYFTHTDTLSVYNVYEEIERTEEMTKTLQFSSFLVPVLLYYEQKLSKNWFLDLQLGANLHINQVKWLDVTDNQKSWFTIRSTQYSGSLRTTLRYQWNKIGLGLGNNVYYIGNDHRLFDIKRQKWVYEINLGIHYKF